MPAVNAKQSRSRARSVAYCGLTVALLTVSAWVTVPIGVVPITLQTFALVFALLFLKPRDFMASLGVYLLIGAVGLPVFSGMRGGIGVFAGPTGGFLWGFVLGGAVALLVSHLLRARKAGGVESSLKATMASSKKEVATTRLNPEIAEAKVEAKATSKSEPKSKQGDKPKWGIISDAIVAVSFIAVSYVCGWIQLMFVAGMDPLQAFMVAIAPFVVFDALKVAAAIVAAKAVRSALPQMAYAA